MYFYIAKYVLVIASLSPSSSSSVLLGIKKGVEEFWSL